MHITKVKYFKTGDNYENQEFAENNPAVPGEHGEGSDVVRVVVGRHTVSLAILAGNSRPCLVKINGKPYQSLKTPKKAGKFFDKAFKKLAEIAE